MTTHKPFLSSKAYLTIDDSPSEQMPDLCAFLFEKGIPALFYCRGDQLEKHKEAAIDAVQKGFVLANHAYSHQRASVRDFAWITQEITRTQALIEDIYHEAGFKPRGRFFRFPQLDRGTGAWVVDYGSYSPEDRADLEHTFLEGLNVLSMDKPDAAALEKKKALQHFLRKEGFCQPFRDVTAPWFSQGEIGAAADSLYTFSNCDWMMTARHRGKWPYKSINDLKEKAFLDKWLTKPESVNVILAHDQAEIVDITIDLVNDLAENGLGFLEV